MSLDPALRSRIESLLAANPVVLFMKGNPRAPACGFSSKAVAALDAAGATYAHVDVLADPDEFAARRDSVTPPAPRYTSGVLAKYVKLVGAAAGGAVCG